MRTANLLTGESKMNYFAIALEDAAGSSSSAGLISTLLMVAVVVVAFYFFLIRRIFSDIPYKNAFRPLRP